MVTWQKGFTIVEMLVTAALLLVMIMTGTRVVLTMKQVTQSVSSKISENQQMQNVLENIVKGFSLHQISFDDTSVAKDAFFADPNYRFAWGGDIFAMESECPHCPGRMDFFIQPHQDLPGLFTVNVRVTHKDWPHEYSEYVFMVTSK